MRVKVFNPSFDIRYSIFCGSFLKFLTTYRS